MAEKQLNEDRPERRLHEYYRNLDSIDIFDQIKDFDHGPNLEAFKVKARDARSKNFILDFSDSEAWCGFDLDAESYKLLLITPRPPELNTRWINIWLPYEQKDILAEIGKCFEFTPRLLGFMGAEQPKIPRLSGPTRTSTTSSFSSLFTRSRDRSHRSSSSSNRSPQYSTYEKSGDLEQGSKSSGFSDFEFLETELDFRRAWNPYVLADDIWHWSSVDRGRRCKSS
jgi:hypothetical protein